MVIGIDYGSRLAGTTVICYQDHEKLSFLQSLKNEDADDMIRSFVAERPVSVVAIDAPLSLPKAYAKPRAENPDFHYRSCDRQTSAMSPMFLGGLTARAMKLVHELGSGLQVIEVYPNRIAERYALVQIGYKKANKHLKACTMKLEFTTDLRLKQAPKNWHQFDAWLAYFAGREFSEGRAQSVGDPDEGLIYF